MKAKAISILIFTALLTLNISCKKEPETNKRLVAKAGNDTTILLPANQALLDGSGSYATDNIKSYQWTKISGPDSYIIINSDSAATEVTDLIKGIYAFRLKITDSNGETNSDTCLILVNTPSTDPANFWIAINPHDTVLNLPFNTLNLKASTWSMTNEPIQPAIAKIEWKKIFGPDNYTIQPSTSFNSAIGNLRDGLYAFECKITDSLGRSSASNTVINVTDTTVNGQEVIVPNQTWYGTLGDCIYLQFNLSQYIPAGKSIKKVFIKQDCDTAFTRVYYINTPENNFYSYQFSFFNNEFYLTVYDCNLYSNCSFGPNNEPDIKIIY